MTEAQAVEAISARFLAAWPGASGSTPFALVNEARLAVDTFAQLQFLPGIRQPISQGASRMYESHTWVVVQLWTPVNAGAAPMATLIDAARAVFERQTLTVGSERLTMDAGMTRGVAKNFDGRWDISAVQFDAWWFESR